MYARDKKHCYFQSNRLAGADRESFVVLNPTYAKDKAMVWAFGSRIKEADAASFEACDAGAQPLSIRKDAIEPYMEITEKGYGKDANNVYYMGF
nr:DKNYY domain-containing protein [Capnocytophaga haemolytica]